MANVKNIIQTFFAEEPLMLQLFDTTGIFDPQNKKNIDLEITREVQGEAWDVHRVVFTYTSDEPIIDYIHLRCFWDSLKNMKGPNLLKVALVDYSIEENSDGNYVAQIEFTTVDNIEKI